MEFARFCHCFMAKPVYVTGTSSGAMMTEGVLAEPPKDNLL